MAELANRIYKVDFEKTDFRKNPELYRVGRGEEWVLSAKPYKGEILPAWKFATPADAEVSSKTIYAMFLDYLKKDDFPGADMARKFLQMGFTRSKRYANHKSGKKYDGPVPADKKGQSGSHGRAELPKDEDPVKAESARIFYEKYVQARENPEYKKRQDAWKEKYG